MTILKQILITELFQVIEKISQTMDKYNSYAAYLAFYFFLMEKLGAPSSSDGRALDSGSRGQGFKTCAGHMVVGSDHT